MMQLSGLDAVLEQFDKRTGRRIDRRTRLKTTLIVNTKEGGEVTLTMKLPFGSDVWCSKDVKVFDESVADGKLSISVAEYHTVLLLSNGVPTELTRLVELLRKAMNSSVLPGENRHPNKGEEAKVIAKIRPRQLLCPPCPPCPSSPEERPQQLQPPPLPKPSFQSPPKGVVGSGYTPNKKKTNTRATPPPKVQSSAQQQQQQQQQQARQKAQEVPTSGSPLAIKPSELTRTQKQALEACKAGKNVFLTGGAGTGKSSLLGLVVNILRSRHSIEGVNVCATTGLAACLIGGTTLHQFAGLSGPFNEGDVVDKTVAAVLGRASAVKRWRACKALVIDEVSMLSGALLELVDLVGRRCRGNTNSCFGGVQIIMVGDFFQLPPVVVAHQPTSTQKNREREGDREGDREGGGDRTCRRFAFQSPTWAQLNLVPFVLDHVFRQSDAAFVELLDAVRVGRVTREQLDSINESVVAPATVSSSSSSSSSSSNSSSLLGILPTQIFTHKADSDRLNASRLDELDADTYTYNASDAGETNMIGFLDKFSQAKKTLKLKAGAQVILLRTLDATNGLVNGARGVVVRFTGPAVATPMGGVCSLKRGPWPVVKFACGVERRVSAEIFSVQQGGIVVSSREQIPLDCAWAISVHKSQGMSIDRAVLHLKGVFEFGQAYVALSRIKSQDGLELSTKLQLSHIRAHPEVINFYERLTSQTDNLKKL